MPDMLKGSKPVSIYTSKQPTSHISCALKSMPALFVCATWCTNSSGDVLAMAVFTSKKAKERKPAQDPVKQGW